MFRMQLKQPISDLWIFAFAVAEGSFVFLPFPRTVLPTLRFLAPIEVVSDEVPQPELSPKAKAIAVAASIVQNRFIALLSSNRCC